MESFLRLVESSGLSVWIRESDSLLAFPGILVLHTLGMAFLAGAAVAVALPMLATPVRPETVARLTPIAWAGFAANALSGVLLVVAYPTKALTNPIFYVKLALVGLLIGAFHFVRLWWNKGFAAALLLLASLTIVGGRLLPYTYTRLLALD